MEIRAKTYQLVARGQCPSCKEGPVDLRFVYNPYGHDNLVCEPCGEGIDGYFTEHGQPNYTEPHGKTDTEITGDIVDVVTEAYNGWPPEVRARFDVAMTKAKREDEQHKKNMSSVRGLADSEQRGAVFGVQPSGTEIHGDNTAE